METPSKIEKLLYEINKKGFFSLTHLSSENQSTIAKWAAYIYDQYTSILSKNSLKIKNMNDLPVSKQDVKLALKILMATYYIKGDKNTVNNLKGHYISIGSFQKIDPNDREKLIDEGRQIDQGLKSIYPEYHKYLEIIISEQNALIEDLNQFISDLDTLTA